MVLVTLTVGAGPELAVAEQATLAVCALADAGAVMVIGIATACRRRSDETVCIAIPSIVV
jgi:hypothetical protein